MYWLPWYCKITLITIVMLLDCVGCQVIGPKVVLFGLRLYCINWFPNFSQLKIQDLGNQDDIQ